MITISIVEQTKLMVVRFTVDREDFHIPEGLHEAFQKIFGLLAPEHKFKDSVYYQHSPYEDRVVVSFRVPKNENYTARAPDVIEGGDGKAKHGADDSAGVINRTSDNAERDES